MSRSDRAAVKRTVQAILSSSFRKESRTSILPIGEPIADTLTPALSSAALKSATTKFAASNVAQCDVRPHDEAYPLLSPYLV